MSQESGALARYCLAQVMYESGGWTFDIIPTEKFAAKRRESESPDEPDLTFFCNITSEQAEAYRDGRLLIFRGRHAHEKPFLAIAESNEVEYCLVSQGGKAGEPDVIPVTDYKNREYHIWRLLTMQEQAAHEQGKLNVAKGEKGKGPLVEIVEREG